jgi:hypothetical protein
MAAATGWRNRQRSSPALTSGVVLVSEGFTGLFGDIITKCPDPQLR